MTEAEILFNKLKQETLLFCNNMLELNKDNDNVIIEKSMFKNFKWFVSLQELSTNDSFGDNGSNSG
jgi:glutaredoxin-related protein